jgi:hypothetical protein
MLDGGPAGPTGPGAPGGPWSSVWTVAISVSASTVTIVVGSALTVTPPLIASARRY